MDKDFLTVTPDTGSENGTVTVTASKNTGAVRSSSITIAGAGMTRTIPISQEASLANVIIVVGGENIIKTTIM